MAETKDAAALSETWAIHNRINLYLLAAVSPGGLVATAAGKGRSVGLQFAHMHNVRLMWLKAGAPDLLEGQEKFDTDETPTTAALRTALTRSAGAIDTMVAAALASGSRIKGFKPHATAFVGYLIAHEAHHRGQIALILKLAGEPLDKKVSFGLWEWGAR
jgi:uncharacterized damage-inducible protein DinB